MTGPETAPRRDDGRDREPAYACGHSSRELGRLELQGQVYGPFTRRALASAGLAPGLRVLDVGCGAGDVSLLAAELVGPEGSVTGLDRSPDAVAAARQRVPAAAAARLHFVVADLDTWRPSSLADAVVGRFVLMHQRDPAALVARVRDWVRPGGLLVFLESDIASFRSGGHSRPRSATYERIVAMWDAILTAAGAHVDMGSCLASVLEVAGLQARGMLTGPGEVGNAASVLVPFAAESLRSMLPLARSLQLDVPGDDEAERFEAALRTELTDSGGVMLPPPIVAGWGTRPRAANGA